MADFPLWAWATVPVAAMLIAPLIVWMVAAMPRLRPDTTADDRARAAGAAHILFEQDSVTDHDLPGDLSDRAGDDWPAVRDWLRFRFDGLPETADALPQGETEFRAGSECGDAACLTLFRTGDITRLTLSDPATGDAAERHARLHLQKEQRNWDRCLNNAPCGVAVSGTDGGIVWSNATFKSLAIGPDDAILHARSTMPAPGETHVARRSIDNGQTSNWFETRSVHAGDSTIHYVADVTKVVTAENLRREFVQTLTKTFANLTTGLAVFDRDKNLALFNPALVDLTGLGPDFLSARPDLMGFFDSLRNNHVLPEPRSYADWRTQILQMIETATDGLYRETWTLASGLTYRVTGRPHPDGAVAFLFEDISDEISLTRRFRSQVDIRQAVLDNLSEAVAVLSPGRTVLLCNAACARLLNIDPDSSFAEMTLRDLTRICDERLPDPAFWSTVNLELDGTRLSRPIKATLTDLSGARFCCQVASLPGGASMLTIAPPPAASCDATQRLATTI